MPTFRSKIQILAQLFLAFLVISLSGCDFLYRLLHKEGAEEKKIVGVSMSLEKNPNIEEVQQLLEIYGYNPGSADGVLGRHTRDAIEKFQIDNGINPSRFVDEETWHKLTFFRDQGLVEDGTLNIAAIQRLLKEAGYNPGSADGDFGPKTKEAIMKFQKAHDLKADAKIGYKTLTALSKYHQQPNGKAKAGP